MKKGKVISMPTTVEAQIRTRARSLPVDRCFISSDWEESKSANVVVTRKHVNGNITYGIYLVDLLLLGVKDCSYSFNELPSELDDVLDDMDEEFDECGYELAHNIIYESIAFAQDNGFEPAKDFTKVGKYILEEDTDAILQMDIELGSDGVPVVVVTPDNDRQREMAILDKTVGRENYYVCHVDERGNVLDDDEYDEDDDDDEDDNRYSYTEYMDTRNDIMDIGTEEFQQKYESTITPTQLLAITDMLYEAQFDDKLDSSLLELIIDDERYDMDLDRLPELEKYTESLQSIVDKMEEDKYAALQEMEALQAVHPDDVYLGIAHISILNDLGMEAETDRLIHYWYDREPNHYALRLYYAGWLTEKKRFDEVFELFRNQPGLDAITTEDLPFTESMVCNFCACYVLAWLSKDNIAKAEPYYQLLLMIDNVTKYGSEALLEMNSKKRKAIMNATKCK